MPCATGRTVPRTPLQCSSGRHARSERNSRHQRRRNVHPDLISAAGRTQSESVSGPFGNQHAIFTAGQVVWSESSGRAGIRFAQLPEESLQQLKEWLFVNVLTAYDLSGAASPAADRRNNASKGPLPSHTIPKDELDSRTAVISSDGRRFVQRLESRPSEIDRERPKEKATWSRKGSIARPRNS